ncbi:hypothetical protein NKG05_16850 [Oerskovia sp. M15]
MTTLAVGDDGVHADGDLTVTDGTLTVSESVEGLEGRPSPSRAAT